MNASAVDDPFYYPPAIVKRVGRERHAVIEASAGTGKTFTIEHLVVDLLLSGDCAVDQILVVTFTEKATAELRIRIRAALEKLRFGVPAPQPAGDTQPVRIGESGRKKLDDAFYSFDRAPIFTIHGFCNRVLTDFAFNSGTLLDLAADRWAPRLPSGVSRRAARASGGKQDHPRADGKMADGRRGSGIPQREDPR